VRLDYEQRAKGRWRTGNWPTDRGRQNMEQLKSVWTDNVEDSLYQACPEILTTFFGLACCVDHIYFPYLMVGGSFKWKWAEPLVSSGRASWIRLPNPLTGSGLDDSYPFAVTDPSDVSAQIDYYSAYRDREIRWAIEEAGAFPTALQWDLGSKETHGVSSQIQAVLHVLSSSAVGFHLPNVHRMPVEEFLAALEAAEKAGEALEFRAYLLDLIAEYSARLAQGATDLEIRTWAEVIVETKIAAAVLRLEKAIASQSRTERLLKSDITGLPEAILNPLKWLQVPAVISAGKEAVMATEGILKDYPQVGLLYRMKKLSTGD